MSVKPRNMLPRRLKSSLVNDWGRKLIALFFALLLYYYGCDRGPSVSEQISNVPLEVRMPPELLNMAGSNLYSATLEVKSPRELRAGEIHGVATVDFADFVPGKPYRLKLTPENFTVPFGARVRRVVSPTEISMNLQRRVSKTVEVRVVTSGKLHNDYKKHESCRPSTVQVVGPEQIVNELRFVNTAPVPLSETVMDSFDSDQVAVESPGGTVTVSPDHVAVSIEVTKNADRRLFKGVPVRISSPPGSEFQVELPDESGATVAVTGPIGAVGALKTSDVRVYLDISHIDHPGIYDIDLGCYVKGEGLSAKLVSPEAIKVKITK